MPESVNQVNSELTFYWPDISGDQYRKCSV